MKKLFLIITVSLMALSIYAQSNKEEVDLLQAAFGMDKKAAAAEFFNVTDSQKDAFWKLYDEYEAERKELGKERIELLSQYAEHYKDMTNEQASAWTPKVIDLGKRTDKLIETYYGKILKATDAIVATQFYQFEAYILTAIRGQLLEEVPFLQKKK